LGISERSNQSLIIGFVIALIPVIPYITVLITLERFSYFTFGGSQDQTSYVARAHAFWLGLNPGLLSGAPEGPDSGQINNVDKIFSIFGLIFRQQEAVFPFAFFAIYLFSILALLYCLRIFNSSLPTQISSYLGVAVSFLVLPQLIQNRSISFPITLSAYRWPFPMVHFCLVLLTLTFILIKPKRPVLILSLLIGISFYTYFYSWQIILALVASSALFNLGFGNLDKVKELLKSILIGCLLGLPAVRSLFLSRVNLQDNDRIFFETINNVAYTHKPHFTLTMMVLLVFTIYFWIKGGESKEFHLSFVSFLTSVLIYNQQIFTGIVVQPGHYHWYFIQPISYLIFFIWLRVMFRSLHAYKMFCSLGAILLMSVQFISLNESIQSVRTISIGSNSIKNELNPNFKYITFESPISDYLVVNSKLIPVFNSDYGPLYTPAFEKTTDSLLIYSYMKVQNPTVKNIVNYALSCAESENSICGWRRNLQATLLQRENLESQSLQDLLTVRVSNNPNLFYKTYLQENNIGYFFTSAPATQIDVERLHLKSKRFTYTSGVYYYSVRGIES
jgi:hypothetical protein